MHEQFVAMQYSAQQFVCHASLDRPCINLTHLRIELDFIACKSVAMRYRKSHQNSNGWNYTLQSANKNSHSWFDETIRLTRMSPAHMRCVNSGKSLWSKYLVPFFGLFSDCCENENLRSAATSAKEKSPSSQRNISAKPNSANGVDCWHLLESHLS